jgi:hypothetical protein
LPSLEKIITNAAIIIKAKANHLADAVMFDNRLNHLTPNKTTIAHPIKQPMEIKSIHKSVKAPQFWATCELLPTKPAAKFILTHDII